MAREHYLFVTGRLAEQSVRRVVADLASSVGFDYSICVMPITVAALLTPKWIARRLEVPSEVTRVMLPGYCVGDLSVIEEVAGVVAECGPRDIRLLSEFFGRESEKTDYGDFDIEIIAQVKHAAGLSRKALVAEASRLESQGADVIDLGCQPGQTWSGVSEAVRALRDEGRRVSINSRDPKEIAPAVRAGAELVLSVNRTNREYADDWGCEVVVTADEPRSLEGIDETVELLSDAGVPWRINPTLSPISFGFAESLGRYLQVRNRWPEAEMMMGLGNLTELTDVDSAGMNVLLLGFCQEIGVRSVLTTEQVDWTRSAVRECHLARQLVHYAVTRHVLPRHLEPGLVMLRDTKVLEYGREGLAELTSAIKDRSFRIIAEGGRLHVIVAGSHLEGRDPFDLFDQMESVSAKPIDASEAFYLGYEMAKAAIALALGKNYRQDEALDWGMLTVPELTRLERRALRMARSRKKDGCSEDDDYLPDDGSAGTDEEPCE